MPAFPCQAGWARQAGRVRQKISQGKVGMARQARQGNAGRQDNGGRARQDGRAR